MSMAISRKPNKASRPFPSRRTAGCINLLASFVHAIRCDRMIVNKDIIDCLSMEATIHTKVRQTLVTFPNFVTPTRIRSSVKFPKHAPTRPPKPPASPPMRHMPFYPVHTLFTIRPRSHRIPRLVPMTPRHGEVWHGVLSRRRGRRGVDGCGGRGFHVDHHPGVGR